MTLPAIKPQEQIDAEDRARMLALLERARLWWLRPSDMETIERIKREYET